MLMGNESSTDAQLKTCATPSKIAECAEKGYTDTPHRGSLFSGTLLTEIDKTKTFDIPGQQQTCTLGMGCLPPTPTPSNKRKKSGCYSV